MLNAKYPDRSIMPSSLVQRIAAHLLEDWADEWFADMRSAVAGAIRTTSIMWPSGFMPTPLVKPWQRV